ncbi:ATP-dependent Clp protease adaptor ClpS [Treponema pedis]|uniref:ATP-dependent Clp protease adapter protein ClpS n=5 Tax=Treponema pedis TaxID=409322 RepID=S5ZRL0_9SPIR|nr:ATP-dependent Clp protease adaptor ClpS [Treponema pedis]AGT42660.1 ATP-dependent Clp protease adaptor protein ClpS [Treponema pedis str. T A4]QOW61676.1 ATP-dependent Clp protease adaptor ClpS [Treponema pedis]QSI03548.1 ATP-dependent Clp protease adaptor ClpS [Treponema pedis]
MEAKKQLQKGTIISEKLKEPDNYKIILINDDYTPMDFVVAILIELFNKSPEEAEILMMKVHNTGEAVIGVYVYDIATTKCFQVLTAAKNNGFPLQCRIEKL